jgi:hypothetical protein
MPWVWIKADAYQRRVEKAALSPRCNFRSDDRLQGTNGRQFERHTLADHGTSHRRKYHTFAWRMSDHGT